ncbi:MAG: hypothetical protein H6998_00095 [Hahellaceae bacterium]|nr:hypothetical protein [Hahellaceae bacterium]
MSGRNPIGKKPMTSAEIKKRQNKKISLMRDIGNELGYRLSPSWIHVDYLDAIDKLTDECEHKNAHDTLNWILSDWFTTHEKNTGKYFPNGIPQNKIEELFKEAFLRMKRFDEEQRQAAADELKRQLEQNPDWGKWS